MSSRRVFNLLLSLVMIASLFMGSSQALAQTLGSPAAGVAAVPASPTDESKVPHYFGPYPNWANSPFSLPDVTITINGNGTGAKATAVVGGNGAITAINVTDPGIGYTTATVSITGAGSGASATATVTLSGMVTKIDVLQNGAGYTKPVVSLAGGGSVVPVQVGNPLVDRAYATDWAVAPTVVQPSVTPVATRIFTATAGSANGGTFILNVNGVLTAPIAWNAPAADVQAALTAAGITATVTGAGTVADPWVITFAVAPAAAPTIDAAALTHTVAVTDASVTAGGTLDVYNVSAGSANGGAFTLAVDTLLTAPIAWNAPAADVQAALTAAGITATVTGAGTVADPWVITFAVAPAATPAVDGTGLTQPSAPTTIPAFVILPTALPTGTLKSFVTQNQATAGGSPTPSTGNRFNAYVLRPTGTPDQYTVVYDSGTLTVPALANPAVSEIATFTVPDIAVQAGDVIAFYGAGIPVDIVTTGTDLLYYPSNAAPVQGATIAVGGVEYPLYNQARTYSFAANVVDASVIPAPTTGATATAYGGVDAITVDPANSGSGYTLPTVDFDLPDDPNGVQPTAHAVMDANGAITQVVVDTPGSGYSAAPNVVIRDGTIFDPVAHTSGAFVEAKATATLTIQNIMVDTFGSGYTSAPAVTISDAAGTGTGAQAVAFVTAGGVTSITVDQAGSGYVTQGGIKKFQDGLPVLCDPTAGWANCTDNNLGQHIPIAVPDTTTFSKANGFSLDADFYVIAVVQHREQMSSSLPASGSLLREYVQLETPANASFSKHVALTNDLQNGTSVPALMPDGSQAYAVDDPHFLGPVISATKDKPVRIVFYNLLPTGVDGNLFLPVDTTLMGSGMGPMANMPAPVNQGTVMDGVRNPLCTDNPQATDAMGNPICYAQDRATLHLHGGTTPWISDGTPHQWITPANENTQWPQGISVSEVPDMGNVPGVPNCTGANDGCMTFYYTNQQSARLLFYHDHSWGITRLNVYAGEAAGYLITDATEQKLISSGVIPADQIPLIIQDRTFVPSAQQLSQQDPTWDYTRWGGYGDLWYHHVYMPAQNPGDPSGMSAYGRWMYGPWFWPPATPANGPIANPYYDPNCSLDNPATWQYQTDPFCEPAQIPGTPNISVGMEQFNDTPVVNGTAYPTTTVQPKSYRMRILNAANDRFWNLQWYVADPRTGTDSEVALNSALLAAAQTDPTVFPTPDTTWSPAGPSWIQIGSEGGFLPAPTVVPNQPITWITDPTRFDFGNVDKHALLLAPAERADVIVDFSKYAGKTLILYNDAPAAFPARIASYDYYTGAPDLSPVGAPAILPGYGPNTRTIMQIKVAASTPAPAFNLTALQNAFKHHADGSGVFESGQHPIIVGQAAYNSAYGSTFAASSDCNAPNSTLTKCDGLVRINLQGGDQFKFNSLRNQTTSPLSIPLQPKALHDEMNAAAFDEFGRMTANIGLEAIPATPALQNVILYPYVNPSTELIDGTNLPKGDINVTPISSSTDGTQIWKITHNGVDTHPIHFHLYDVQILNRVTWDNIIIPTEPSELGWKDTIRVSPLEDTIVALRPIIPTVPFELPNSIHPLNPMMPLGDTTQFNNIDAKGNPTNPIVNSLVNFGWEYVYHCHILSHEEMDMMRPVSVALPPNAPDGLTWTVTKNGLVLTWNDNSINETSFVIQKKTGAGAWVNIGTITSPLNQPNIHQLRSFTDSNFKLDKNIYSYQVVAQNTIGYGGQFMSLTAQSVSAPVSIVAAPSNLTATLQAGPQVRLTWMDNATNETGFIIQRSTDGVNFTQIGTAPARNNTGSVTYNDTAIATGTTYTYRVAATSVVSPSAFSNIAQVTVPVAPAAPTSLTAANGANSGNNRSVILTWTANTTNVTSFTIQRATNAAFTTGLTSTTASSAATNLTVTGLNRNTNYYFRIIANNGVVPSAPTNATPLPILTNP